MLHSFSFLINLACGNTGLWCMHRKENCRYFFAMATG